MGQVVNDITIYKKDGSVRTKLNSYTNKCVIKSAEQKVELLGEDSVTIKTTSAAPIECSIGDYIIVYGSVYTLNNAAEIVKTGERKFECTMKFEGLQYKLMDTQFRNADAGGYNPTANFSVVANLKMLMQILVNNANRTAAYLGEVWSLGIIPEDTEYREFSWNNQNCLAVLQSACQSYETEFDIVETSPKHYTINIQKQGSVFPMTFDYSKQSGVVKLTRKNVNNNSIVSRLYIEGGTANISKKYRNGSDRLRIDNDGSYVEDRNAISIFGIKESSKQYDDIYPKRKGKVSEVVADNNLQFVDSTMFDLNAKDPSTGDTIYLQGGAAAKVRFTGTCPLAGYEFEVAKYDHKTHTFTINQYEDKRGLKIPDGGSYSITKDSEYILVDVVMPTDPYLTDAETELREQGLKDLAKVSQPMVDYELEIASFSLERAHGMDGGIVNVFRVGDYLPIVDKDINVDKNLRIKGFTRNAYNDPYSYKVTLGDTIDVSIVQKLIEDTQRHDEIITINNLTNVARARQNWRTTQELLNMVFDGDGYFDASNIKPNSIETMMLSVGNRASQFVLQDLQIACNNIKAGRPNPQSISVKRTGSVSTLIHYAIEDSTRFWNLASDMEITLQTTAPYYIYAQCPKSSSVFRIVVSQSKINTEADGMYFFLIGVLSSVFDGYRELTLTYGSTRITGRTINCGRIESIDKNTYFDLDNSEIGGNIKFRSTDGTIKDVAGLEDGIAEVNGALQDIRDITDSLQEQIDGTVEYWYGDVVPTTTNYPANEWTTDEAKQEHIGDVYTDTVTGLEYRFSYSKQQTYYWQEVASSGIGTAIQRANEALGLAGDKSHTYITASYEIKPAPTYKKGDMWVTLDNLKMYYCIANGDGNRFNIQHWRSAGYTDDTAANEALSKLSDIASDSKLTASEKALLKTEISNIAADYVVLTTRASEAGVDYSAFDEAYTALVEYATPLLADMSVTSDIDRDKYNSVFSDYYTERGDLIIATSKSFVDSLEIGQGNYIANGAFFKDTNGWVVNGTDTIITPEGKANISSISSRVKTDYSMLYGLCSNYHIQMPSSYTAAYNNLLSYTGSILADMTTTTIVDTNTINSRFAFYDTQRESLSKSLKSAGVPASTLDKWKLLPTYYGDCELFMDSRMGSVLRMSKQNTTQRTFLRTSFHKNGGNIMVADAKFKTGAQYTLAFWVKANKNLTAMVGIMNPAGDKAVADYYNFKIGTDWKRIVYTFTAKEQQDDNTNMYIRLESLTTYDYLMFTKFVLVEGNKAPEWTSSADELKAKMEANEQTLKAITDNYTQIDGGLILSTYLKLGALLNGGQWLESAGVKAMLESKDEIAAYFGGSLADAIQGKDGMTIIKHDGSFKADNAEITGKITATDGKFLGSMGVKFNPISDDSTIYLSFDTGFNFAGCSYQQSGVQPYNIYQTIYLPADIKYEGVKSIIENTARVSQTTYIDGKVYFARYFRVKTANGLPFRNIGNNGYAEDITEIEIYGMSHVAFHAVVVDGVLRWAVENPSSLRYPSQVNNVLSTWRGMSNIGLIIWGELKLYSGNQYQFLVNGHGDGSYLWAYWEKEGKFRFEWDKPIKKDYFPIVVGKGHVYGWCYGKTETQFYIETADDSSNNTNEFELIVLGFV